MKKILLPLLFSVGFAFFITNSLVRTDMTSPEARHTAMKTVLKTGLKECIVRDSDNQTTKFSDAQSFSQSNFSHFKIQPIDPNSCYKAKAVYESNLETWYQIVYDPETEEVLKTCGDSSKRGCEEGNTW